MKDYRKRGRKRLFEGRERGSKSVQVICDDRICIFAAFRESEEDRRKHKI